MSLEMKDPYWEFTIEMQPGHDALDWHDPLLNSTSEHHPAGLCDELHRFQKLTGMKEMELLFISGNEYTWELVHSDTRRWFQTIHLGDTVPTTEMNFDVPDFWTIQELRGGRAQVLTLILELLLVRKIQRIKVDWF